MDCQDGTGEAGGLCIFAFIGEEHSYSVLFPPPTEKGSSQR